MGIELSLTQRIGEVLGYIARAVSAAQPYGEWTLSPYIVQTVLVLVAPSLFAASVYMELGRIVELVQGDQYLFIRRRWLTGIFVLGDVVSFLMQAGGKHYYVSRQIYVCPVLRGSYRIGPEATEMNREERGAKKKYFKLLQPPLPCILANYEQQVVA